MINRLKIWGKGVLQVLIAIAVIMAVVGIVTMGAMVWVTIVTAVFTVVCVCVLVAVAYVVSKYITNKIVDSWNNRNKKD